MSKTWRKRERRRKRFECFSVTPVDLYRTAKPSQIRPLKFAHTKHAANPWTKASSVFCAGFNRGEGVFPWWGVDSHGNVQVNGVSLFAFDMKETILTDEQATNPFADIGVTEETDVFSMTIPQCKELCGGGVSPSRQNKWLSQ
jgi:hypothetical protein